MPRRAEQADDPWQWKDALIAGSLSLWEKYGAQLVLGLAVTVVGGLLLLWIAPAAKVELHEPSTPTPETKRCRGDLLCIAVAHLEADALDNNYNSLVVTLSGQLRDVAEIRPLADQIRVVKNLESDIDTSAQVRLLLKETGADILLWGLSAGDALRLYIAYGSGNRLDADGSHFVLHQGLVPDVLKQQVVNAVIENIMTAYCDSLSSINSGRYAPDLTGLALKMLPLMAPDSRRGWHAERAIPLLIEAITAVQFGIDQDILRDKLLAQPVDLDTVALINTKILAILEKAEPHLTSSVQQRHVRLERARALADLGLLQSDKPEERDLCLRRIDEAIHIYEYELTHEIPGTLHWADLQDMFGLALRIRGDLARDPTFVLRSRAAHQAAQGVMTRHLHPIDWAKARVNEAMAVESIGDTVHPPNPAQWKAAKRMLLEIELEVDIRDATLLKDKIVSNLKRIDSKLSGQCKVEDYG